MAATDTHSPDRDPEFVGVDLAVSERGNSVSFHGDEASAWYRSTLVVDLDNFV